MVIDLQSGFLLDINENPHDDTPRLIYADYLEENEHTDFAEFIRVQIELEKTNAYLLNAPGTFNNDGPFKGITNIKSMNPRWQELKTIEERLLNHLVDSNITSHLLPYSLRKLWYILPESEKVVDFTPRAYTRRGFINTLRCSLQTFLEDGIEIARINAITNVEITDREPVLYSPHKGIYLWSIGDNYDNTQEYKWSLPREIQPFVSDFDKTGHIIYPSREEAIQDLKNGCLKYIQYYFFNQLIKL
jgi:uncharacterized protein (TIGR02996 family)